MITTFTVGGSDAFKFFRKYAFIVRAAGVSQDSDDLATLFHSAQSWELILDGASLVRISDTQWALQYHQFLSMTPHVLGDEDLKVLGVRLVRKNSTPTAAKPGHYSGRSSLGGFCTATVEEFVIHGRDRTQVATVHNITVSSLKLVDVLKYHSTLVQGDASDDLIYPFN